MNWYIAVLKKYAVIDGRARRKEYWFFVLISTIIAIMLGIVDSATPYYDPETGMGILGALYSLGVLIPSIAVAVRRLHDTGRSGWWLLIVFIPLLGAIALIVFLVLASEPGDNAYGPNPIPANE